MTDVEVAYDYDTFGRLKTIEDRLGLESTYAYNDDFTLKSLTLPNGTVTNYTYDDLRRLVSIATSGLSAGDIITKFTYQYNELGLRDKVTMADGRATEWDYDDVGRLVEEHFKSAGPSPTTLLRYIYTYDAAGNRTSKKTDYDNNDGNGYAATATYTNNGYNQLTAVSGTPGRGSKVNVTGTIPTAWTLADNDVTVTPNSTPANAVNAEVHGRFFIARNVPLTQETNSIEASTDATTLADHSPSSDTVQSVKLDTSLNVSYTYDANGNLTVKSEEGGSVLWTYTYSVDDWLIKVEGPNGLVEEYEYDPIGRKYKTQTTSAGQTITRYFVYDSGSVILELDSDVELNREFIRGISLGGGIGGLLYIRDSVGDLGYFHYDGQGNVVSVTDESREELAYYEYDAWGNLLTACGSLANEFAFSTKQASTGTGLIDFGYRHYDPTVGRWTQRDPIGADGGLNLYAYLMDCPVSFLDPWGLVITFTTWMNENQKHTPEAARNMWKDMRKKAEEAVSRKDGDEFVVCEAEFLLELMDFLDAEDREWLVKVGWDKDSPTFGITAGRGDDLASSQVHLGPGPSNLSSGMYTLIHEAFHAAIEMGFKNVEWCKVIDDQRFKKRWQASGEHTPAWEEFGAVFIENIVRQLYGEKEDWIYKYFSHRFDFSKFKMKVTCESLSSGKGAKEK